MIVTCVRCNTEFNSDHIHTHACPKCHFVFSSEDLKEDKVAVISSSELWRQKGQAHRLHEETGARCAFHPDIDATGNCSGCGKPVCYACAIETSDGCFCEHCVDASAAAPLDEYSFHSFGEISEEDVVETRPSVAAPIRRPQPARPAQPEAVIPWERRRQIGRQKALFATWRAAILSPSKMFSNVGSGGGYVGPLFYGTNWILFGLAGGLMWRWSITVLPKILVFIYGKPIEIKLPFPVANVTFGLVFASVPFVVMLLLLAMCMMFHLFVFTTIRGNSGFKATLKVVCYSAGAFGFYFVPGAGGLLAGISLMMMVAIGFKQAHRISLRRAVATAFVPCSVLFVAGLFFASWAVQGSRLKAFDILAWLLPRLSG